jgi:hypothetical protein
MPEASGLEAIPEILKAHPQAKIIVLTFKHFAYAQWAPEENPGQFQVSVGLMMTETGAPVE